MIDRFGRTINYLRISVTDRCNLRCRYCMPEEGVKFLDHSDILSFEEVADVVRCAVDKGVNKVRLTGGEPLVRRRIAKLVESIASIKGVADFAMTTNGTLLAEHAQALADAGLKRINVSLDTMNPERYRVLTRCGRLEDCLAGIAAAMKVGLYPVKLNCVVGRFSTADDVQSVKDFGGSAGLEVRLIRQMVFETGCFSVVEGGSGGDCLRCNRLRLLSNGDIRPCLFSDMSFNIRTLGVNQAIKAALARKPQSGGPCTHNMMYRIGG